MGAGAAPARTLAAAIEPVAAHVYFSPECHDRYEALGFDPSPRQAGDVALPDGPAYFCSRGSLLGQVPGQVVAAAFAVFNPAAVVPAVDHGWTLTDASTIGRARTEGATAQLVRLIGEAPGQLDRAIELLMRAGSELRPEGRPLYAGLMAVGLPDTKVGVMWRLADRLREYRGDAHIAAWTSAGFDDGRNRPAQRAVLGRAPRTYVRTRAWSTADLDRAEERLTRRGSLAGGRLTDAGRAEREAVEVATDAQCRPIVDALGDDLSELVGILRPWGAAIRAGGGYPASGPHDLAAAAARR